MNLLKVSSWSINVKIFIIMLMVLISLNIINTPLNIQTFSDVNRQAFQQVVTESALRQRDAIDEDFSTALAIVEQFPEVTIPYLSTIQWLTRSDPNTENFDVEATQAQSAAEIALKSDLLDLAPTLFRQAWLIDVNGQVIANVTNVIEPRFDVEPAQYVDVSDSPAHRAGQILGSTDSIDRRVDLVVEQVDNRLSLQLILAVTRNDNFFGTLVVELNNVSVILSNIQLSGINNDIYSFVASPTNSDIAISLPSTTNDQINLNTQATRSSDQLPQAVSYQSGDRQVIGYYTPIFDDFRNDVIFVVELDERIALQDIATSVINTAGPTLLLEIFFLVMAVALINQLYVRPIRITTNAIRAITGGDFRSSFPINTGDDEVGELAQTVIEMRHQLNDLTTDMANRTQTRSRDLQVTQEIGRVAISETNLDRLMDQVVDLLQERFDAIYHAQIFLIEGNYAVLKASTGEAGEKLLASGHRLGVGSLSVIGQVTQQNQTIVARDTASSEVHRRNELLQNTRAELAIPLRIGSQVIGALDLQSVQRDSFDEDAIAILETMANQIAIAIENSRLYTQVQQRLQEFENINRQRSEYNWLDFMSTQRANEIVNQAGARVVYDFSALRQQALNTQQIAVGDLTERNTIPVALPIRIRTQILGVIEWEILNQDFNSNRILLAEELASRLAVSLDNARLVQAGRQTATNERIINSITAKISEQTDIERILQTAIQEVGQVLRAPHVNIQLHQSDSNGHSNGNGHRPSDDEQ